MIQENSLVNRIPHTSLKNYMDYKIGALGATIMGGTIFFVNLSEGVAGASTAALKQGIYTFIFAGVVTRICEKFATSSRSRLLSYSLAVLIPASLTITATYGIHRLKGTPKPLNSTIPTAVSSLIGLPYWAYRSRKKLEERLSE